MGVGYTEEELLDHLREVKGRTIKVDMLVFSFGGTDASHTQFLQKLVRQGKLVFNPNPRWGGTYSLPEECR